MSKNVKNRINEALNLRGMKAKELSEKTGLTEQSISPWRNQRWQPKQDALLKMSKILDVSELWLAGYDVPMERPAERKQAEMLNTAIQTLKKKPQLMRLLIYADSLNPEYLATLLNLAKQLAEADQLKSDV